MKPSRFVEMMLCMKGVAVCHMRMVRSLFMIAGLVMLGRFIMMRGRVSVMFCSLLMMISAFVLSHDGLFLSALSDIRHYFTSSVLIPPHPKHMFR